MLRVFDLLQAYQPGHESHCTVYRTSSDPPSLCNYISLVPAPVIKFVLASSSSSSMELIKLIPIRRDHRGASIVVEPLPARTGVAVAGHPCIAPDPAIVMQLVELGSRCDNSDSLPIVVEPLPARTGVAVAGRPCIAPDPAIVMQLVELVPRCDNSDSLPIVVSRCQPGQESPLQGVPV